MGSALVCGASKPSAHIEEAEKTSATKTSAESKQPLRHEETPPLFQPEESTNCLQSQLVAMGFQPNAACVALVNNDDLESAVQWLCENEHCLSHSSRSIEEGRTPEVVIETPRTVAKAILLREKQGLLEHEERELAVWSRKVRAEVEHRKRRISDLEAHRRWQALARELPEIQTRCKAAVKKSHLAGALKRAGEETPSIIVDQKDESEQKMANLLRRADAAHHDAERQREQVTQFCRSVRPQIDTQSLEKVYLFLKDKVHNKENLDENGVRQVIFNQYEICETAGTDLVPQVLELILVEEDALLLKKLINALFNSTKDVSNDRDSISEAALFQCWRKRQSNNDYDQEEESIIKTKLNAALQQSYEIVQASLLPQERAEVVIDLTMLLQKAKEADSVLLDRIQGERQVARKALHERLASRKKTRLAQLQKQGAHGAGLEAQSRLYDENIKKEIAEFDNSNEAETIIAAATMARDQALANMCRRRATARAALKERLARRGDLALEEDEERLFNTSQDAAAEATLASLDQNAISKFYSNKSSRADALDRGRCAARDALKRRLLKKKISRASHEEELRLLDERFAVVVKATTMKSSSQNDISAAELLERLAAEQRELERKLAAERAQRSAQLERRRRENSKSVPKYDKNSEISTLRQSHLHFAEQVLSFTVSRGLEVDPAAIATLIGVHEDALESLSEALDKRAETRSNALTDRRQRRREEAKLEQERSAELARLVAEQRAQLLQAIEIDDTKDESLLKAYLVRTPKPEAVAAVLAGVSSALENDSDNDDKQKMVKPTESAASIIHNHAQETARIHAELEGEREHQRAALRQRLAARFAASLTMNSQDQCVCDEMEDWAVIENEANESELKGLAQAHAVFCGQALGVVGGDVGAVATLVSEHEAAVSNLSADLAKKHAQRREALLLQLQKRRATHKNSTQATSHNISDQVAAAFEALDAELQAERRDEMRALMKTHQAAVLQALASGNVPSTLPTAEKPDLRAQFLALCDDETSAAEKRRKNEESTVSRQRASIERRLAARRKASRLAASNLVENNEDNSRRKSLADTTSLVAQIQQARRRQMMTHQLHTNRQNKLLSSSTYLKEG